VARPSLVPLVVLPLTGDGLVIPVSSPNRNLIGAQLHTDDGNDGNDGGGISGGGLMTLHSSQSGFVRR